MRSTRRTLIQSVILALEALLIVVGIAADGGAKVCMACYWVVVLIYHIADYIDAMEEAREGRWDDEK